MRIKDTRKKNERQQLILDIIKNRQVSSQEELVNALAEHGIRANCFCPGSTDTPMVTEVPRTRFPTYTAPKLMIQRMAQPEEQANIACFLASDDASYITGETIFCVGGWGKK